MISRKSAIFVGLAATALAALTLRAAASTSALSLGPKSTPLQGQRCLLFGDSLAVGLGVRMRKLADEAGCLFNVSAQVSTTTLDWAGNRLDLLLSSQRPAVALVSLGTNDATMSDPERARSRIQAIVESAKKYGVRLYWIGPPSLPARIQGADAIRAMIRETGVPYFESDKIEFERSSDGVHATMLGYRGWADAVWEWMLGREQAQ